MARTNFPVANYPRVAPIVHRALRKAAEERKGDRDQAYKPSRVFALGADAEGNIQKAVEIQMHQQTGCNYLPGITGDAMSKAYVKLAKKGLTFAGYALAVNNGLLYHTGMADRPHFHRYFWDSGLVKNQRPLILIYGMPHSENPYMVDYGSYDFPDMSYGLRELLVKQNGRYTK